MLFIYGAEGDLARAGWCSWPAVGGPVNKLVSQPVSQLVNKKVLPFADRHFHYWRLGVKPSNSR